METVETMKNDNIDRRVQRTRQLLNEALMALIVEKGYDAITVQNLIDRANLGRSTFYAHYQDKDDLLLSGMEEVVHSLIWGAENSPEEEGKRKAAGSYRPGRSSGMHKSNMSCTRQSSGDGVLT